MKKILRKEKGYSIIELTIAMGLISALIGGILWMARGLFTDTATNQEVSNIPIITSKIQKRYFSQPNFVGLTNAITISYKLVPDNMVSGGSILNRWGGTVTIVPATINVANDSFSMTYTNVPSKSCLSMVPDLDGTIDVMAVGGTNVKPSGGVVNLTTLATQCNASTSVNIAFTTGK